ncbi:CpsD/CapB family tyrosine-protein kinase, partial [Verrucomicrobiales bacterium]|nr:CpsD/CapB family tyrosine-protein kinase [Verrucomicrobiales bacterium]
SFAKMKEKTLLVDLDLRKPRQHQILGLDREQGVSDFLVKELDISELITTTEVEDMDFLSAGTRAPNPSELLTIQNIKKLIGAIPKKYERIIIDTAPVLAVRDSLAMAKFVNSSVIVYKIGSTHRKALSRLLKIYSENNTYPVGIIANGLPEMSKKSAYYGYYHKYYYGSYSYSYYGGGSYYGEEESQS